MFVPNLALFSPSGVRTFGIIDPIVINANWNSISSAFKNGVNTVTTDTQLTSSIRNVLVDVSGLSANQTIRITLPANPAVGDPPCIVSMLSTGSAIPANCVIITSDGNLINGIAPGNSPYLTAPALWMAGDLASFIFVGGPRGWEMTSSLLAAPVSSLPAFGSFPWQGQMIMTNRLTLSVEALQIAGAFAWIGKTDSTFSIVIGDSSSSFNGAPGPFAIGIGVGPVLYKLTCLGNRSFEIAP